MSTVFFSFSKLGWLFLRPESVLVLILFAGLFLLWRGRMLAARRTLSLGFGLLCLIGVFPVAYPLLGPLERSYAASPQITDPSGIVVLGGSESTGPDFAGRPAGVNHAGDRLISTMDLARRFPDAVVLYSGGRASLTPAQPGDFEVGPDVLRTLGLDETRLIVEGQSRSTAENAVQARGMLPPDAGGPWVLVTSAYHLPRAMASFCAAGWNNLVPYPTDYRSGSFWNDIQWNLAKHLDLLNIAVKEWIGLFAYRLSGRATDAFPATC